MSGNGSPRLPPRRNVSVPKAPLISRNAPGRPPPFPAPATPHVGRALPTTLRGPGRRGGPSLRAPSFGANRRVHAPSGSGRGPMGGAGEASRLGWRRGRGRASLPFTGALGRGGSYAPESKGSRLPCSSGRVAGGGASGGGTEDPLGLVPPPPAARQAQPRAPARVCRRVVVTGVGRREWHPAAPLPPRGPRDASRGRAPAAPCRWRGSARAAADSLTTRLRRRPRPRLTPAPARTGPAPDWRERGGGRRCRGIPWAGPRGTELGPASGEGALRPDTQLGVHRRPAPRPNRRSPGADRRAREGHRAPQIFPHQPPQRRRLGSLRCQCFWSSPRLERPSRTESLWSARGGERRAPPLRRTSLGEPCGVRVRLPDTPLAGTPRPLPGQPRTPQCRPVSGASGTPDVTWGGRGGPTEGREGGDATGPWGRPGARGRPKQFRNYPGQGLGDQGFRPTPALDAKKGKKKSVSELFREFLSRVGPTSRHRGRGERRWSLRGRVHQEGEVGGVIDPVSARGGADL